MEKLSYAPKRDPFVNIESAVKALGLDLEKTSGTTASIWDGKEQIAFVDTHKGGIAIEVYKEEDTSKLDKEFINWGLTKPREYQL